MNTAPSDCWLDRTHVGDCRRLLRQMADDGVLVQMCVTSPPYFRLRSYLPDAHPDKPREVGREIAPSDYIAALVEVFRAVRDILSHDGTLWLVIGDTYAARRSWQAPSSKGHPKHSSAQGNAGAMQVNDGLKAKDLIGIPWLLAFALRQDGWYLRQDIVWAKPNPMPESVRDRCTRSHEYLFLLAKSNRYYFDQTAIRETVSRPRAPGNTHPVRLPPGQRITGTNGHQRGSLHMIGASDTRQKRDVWTIASSPFHGGHFAVFPDGLVTPCILAGSREGDIVLDPFMGSGRTAVTARRLRRHYIGCELNPAFPTLEHLHR